MKRVSSECVIVGWHRVFWAKTEEKNLEKIESNSNETSGRSQKHQNSIVERSPPTWNVVEMVAQVWLTILRLFTNQFLMRLFIQSNDSKCFLESHTIGMPHSAFWYGQGFEQRRVSVKFLVITNSDGRFRGDCWISTKIIIIFPFVKLSTIAGNVTMAFIVNCVNAASKTIIWIPNACAWPIGRMKECSVGRSWIVSVIWMRIPWIWVGEIDCNVCKCCLHDWGTGN